MNEILYRSTRGKDENVPASLAILRGIAGDGGLYVPERFPKLEKSFSELAGLSYQDLAYEVMRLFFTDFTEEELRSCIDQAYDRKFATPKIAPLREADGAYYLELFHGKTLAFKDMALSILPHLLTTAARKNGADDKIVILTATSGDTGKAAMAGFADVPGTEIIVFYPKDGVSPVQERQMVTQKGDNTHVIAIHGNFDDAQTAVKKIFTDPAFAEEMAEAGLRFSSANSINIGRLVPQIVYYFYAYGQLLRSGVIDEGDPIRVAVPTGNFGNILAAWYGKQLGLPLQTLICASNENKVLFDFFESGTYDRNREFLLTTSPSMDILVSSNLERLLYHSAGNDAAKTAELMARLASDGVYGITPEMAENIRDFFGGYVTDEEGAAAIRRVYDRADYVIDPHTAVAASVYENYRKTHADSCPCVITSTASPYKFARSVLHAIDADRYDALSDTEQFYALEKVSGVELPKAVRDLLDAPIRHTTVCEQGEMAAQVRAILGLQEQ